MANDQGTGFTLTRRATLTPERTALIYREEQWTYAELNRLTNRVAHGLHALGVNPRDRVGFLGLHHPRFLFTLFGAAQPGAILLPLHFRLARLRRPHGRRHAGGGTVVPHRRPQRHADPVADEGRDRRARADVRTRHGARAHREIPGLHHVRRARDVSLHVAASGIQDTRP